MHIADFAARAGVSPRALRHYEEQGLLQPTRTTAGYRDYDVADLGTVERIRLMLGAGLPTRTIARFLDCVRTEASTVELELCPDLRAELDAVDTRLAQLAQGIADKRAALSKLTAAGA